MASPPPSPPLPTYQVGDIVERRWLRTEEKIRYLIVEHRPELALVFGALELVNAFTGWLVRYSEGELHDSPTAQVIGHLTEPQKTLLHLGQLELLHRLLSSHDSLR